MSLIDKKYEDLLRETLNGFSYEDPNRKGVFRTQIMDYKLSHEFKDGYPSISTKKVYHKGAIGELLAFLSGSTSICTLWGFGIRFWDKDFKNYHSYTDEDLNKLYSDWKRGLADHTSPTYDLGKIYPYQLRSFNGEVDQMQEVINTLRSNPMATKKTVTLWNPSLKNQKDLALTQCHFMIQFLTRPLSYNERLDIKESLYPVDTHDFDTEEKLDRYGIPRHALTTKFHMHSVDLFLGYPINMMYYSNMNYVISALTNMVPEGFISDLSNVHIYQPHMDAVYKQLENDVEKYGPSKMVLSKNALEAGKSGNLDEFLSKVSVSDFDLQDYESYDPIKADMIPYIK